MNVPHELSLDSALEYNCSLWEFPLHQIPLGLATFDREFILQNCNPIWASAVGRYSASPANPVQPGKHLIDLLPGAAVSLMPLFEQALAGQVVRREAVELKSNGQLSYWDIALAPLSEYGQVSGVVNVLAEVTERVVTRQALEQQAQFHTREWGAMLKVARELISSEPNLLLNLILDQLKELVDFNQAAIVKLEKENFAVLVYPAATPQGEALAQHCQVADTWLRQEVIRRREPIIVADTQHHTLPAHTYRELVARLPHIELADTRSWMGVPIIIREQVIGMLSLFHRDPNAYTPDQVGLVLAFAHHLAIALENDRLYRQVHQLATLTERDRLGRALHDQLAQTLGYINLKTTLANDLLAEGQIHEAQAYLRELKQITQEAYSDVREAIFNLRTKVVADVDFLSALQQYVAQCRTRCGLDIRVVGVDKSLIKFSGEVSVQIMRIVQEAVSNVRKHARASYVTIRFAPEHDQVCLTIEDDGQGFDLGQLTKENQLSFGLEIMRERAESVGGRLEIDAVPGRGARVMVWAPYL